MSNNNNNEPDAGDGDENENTAPVISMVEKKKPGLDAVSARLQNLRVLGKLYNQRGDLLIRKGGKDREMDFLKYDEAAWFFYRSSLAYRQCGRWHEAGDNLLRAGWSYSRLKITHMQLVGAAIYCEAGDTFLKVDISESIEAYKAASKLYADANNLHVAGILEKRIAHLHQQVMVILYDIVTPPHISPYPLSLFFLPLHHC